MLRWHSLKVVAGLLIACMSAVGFGPIGVLDFDATRPEAKRLAFSAPGGTWVRAKVPGALHPAQDDLVRLRYKLQEGDLLEYRVRMSISPEERSTSIGGTETIIVSQVSHEDVVTFAHLANDVRLLRGDGKDVAELSDEEASRHFPPSGKHPVLPVVPGEPWKIDGESGPRNHPYLGSSAWKIHRDGRPIPFPYPRFWWDSTPNGTFSRHIPLFRPLREWAQSFQWVFAQPWIRLPERPIGVGDEWMQSAFVNVFNQTGDVHTRYRLLGFGRIDGYRCAEIRVEQDPAEFTIFAARLHHLEGTVHFALDEGFVVREELVLTTELGSTREITFVSELTRHQELSSETLTRVQESLLLEAAVIAMRRASRIGNSVPRTVPSTVWGANGAADGEFDTPMDVVIDAKGGLYVADAGNHRIQKFDTSGTFAAQWGALGSGEGQFNRPAGVAVDPEGNVYVADAMNHRIQKFNEDGNFLLKWGMEGADNGQLNLPAGIAIDASGHVYVADSGNHRIQKFDGAGTYLTQWGSIGDDNGRFASPTGIAVDAYGNVYVADSANFRIQKFDRDGVCLAQWGAVGSGDGQLNLPRDVATDAAGDVYVVDTGNQRIQRFSDDGGFRTQWGTPGSDDGQFAGPAATAVDAAGNIYVADAGNNRIHRFDAAAIDRVAGEPSGSKPPAAATPSPAITAPPKEPPRPPLDVGDEITLVEIEPAAGTILRPGEAVTFRATVSYRLATAETGSLGILIQGQAEEPGGNYPQSSINVAPGTRTATISQEATVASQGPGRITVFLPLFPGPTATTAETSVVASASYPVAASAPEGERSPPPPLRPKLSISFRKTSVDPESVIVDPVKIHHVEPIYPDFADRTRSEMFGVIVSGTVDESGNVIKVSGNSVVPRTSGDLPHSPLIEAVRQWRFTPGTVDGEPAEFNMTVILTFERER